MKKKQGCKKKDQYNIHGDWVGDNTRCIRQITGELRSRQMLYTIDLRWRRSEGMIQTGPPPAPKKGHSSTRWNTWLWRVRLSGAQRDRVSCWPGIWVDHDTLVEILAWLCDNRLTGSFSTLLTDYGPQESISKCTPATQKKSMAKQPLYLAILLFKGHFEWRGGGTASGEKEF